MSKSAGLVSALVRVSELGPWTLLFNTLNPMNGPAAANPLQPFGCPPRVHDGGYWVHERFNQP